MLGAESWIVLDCEVVIEELAPRKPSIWSSGPPVRRGWLLLHHGLDTAAVVPSGSGLREFLEGLRMPTQVATLVDDDDVERTGLGWQLVTNLVERGFAYESNGAPRTSSDWAELRQAWRDRVNARRQVLFGLSTSLEAVAAMTPAPSIVLTTRVPATVEALATAFEAGVLRAHSVAIDLTGDPAPTSPALRRALRRLRASARISVEHLEHHRELVAEHVASTVVGELAQLATVPTATAVEVRVDWNGLGDPAASYAALEAFTHARSSASFAELPSDPEIAGAYVIERAPPRSDAERAVRSLHLRARAHHLLELEGLIVWGQDPDAEQRWVPSDDDLLPQRPDLLGLTDGSVLVDVAGGFGRVARRLAPQVGPHGTVISIDKEALISDRARGFAAALGIHTIQFRVGLGQHLSVPDHSADAAVLEWGGEIHRDGLLGAVIADMVRVVRPGHRIAVTYRLCNLLLSQLTESIAPYPTIYPALRAAIEAAGLTVVLEKFWGVKPRLSGAPRGAFEERFVPRLVDDLRGKTIPSQPESVDLSLTLIARTPDAT